VKTSIKIEGLEQLTKGLHNLGEASKFRIIRNASRAGARTVQQSLKAAAPKSAEKSEASTTYGRLRSNIKSAQLRGDNGKYSPYYRVSTGDAFWAGFLDKGTGKYNVDPGPKAKGAGAKTHIRPNFWFRKAVEGVRGQVVNDMISNIGRSIKREFDKIK
jgi:HK97 gp10 family phage protein